MHKQTIADGLKIVEYPLVEIRVETKAQVTTELALNEFTLKGVETTLVAQLNINNEVFESFRGDGFCISTPTGSTGYNKSLGGGLIHPSLEAIQIAEIASINNRVYRTLGSSMILPKHHYCDIIPKEGQALLLTLDHLHEQRSDVLSLHCRVAEQKVRFARFRPFPFWNRVRDAFIGYEVK
jgi:NAD+ kinase